MQDPVIMHEKVKNPSHQLTLFALTWAIATLFHYQAFHKWDQGYLVWFAALCLLIKPASLFRFLLLLSVQIAQEVMNLPEKHNHWLFVTIVNLTILSAYMIQSISEKTLNVEPNQFLKKFTPYVYLELFILYFFAVFHKLNYDYFNPEISCGAFFYKSQSSRFVFLPDSWILESASIYATIFFEVIIPLLLISPKRRNLGIFIALVFHGIIGFNPTSEFWNFSSVIYAILVLFTPPDFAKRCLEIKMPIPKIVIFSSVLVSVGMSIFFNNPRFEIAFGLILWTIYMCISVILFITIIKWRRLLKEDRRHIQEKKRFSSIFLFIFPLFLFFNGSSPYLGLKTESSFSMFSNLRTEGGRSNHMLIPNNWQIFTFQKDLVEIKSSSDQYLNSLFENELLLPYFEFHKYLQAHPEISVTYIRNGKLYALANVEETTEFQTNFPWYFKRFLVFRPVSKKSRVPCTR